MQIVLSHHFKRLLKRLPISLRPTIEKRIILFQESPYHPSLKTHKLSGTLHGRWAFSIDYRYRIIFRFEEDLVIFLAVGDHAIYETSV